MLACRLAFEGSREAILQDLIAALQVRAERIEVVLNSDALAVGTGSGLAWSIPLPDRKPFREAKLRIDAEAKRQRDWINKLVQLIADALEARQLVISNPGLSLNQVANKENRCRKQLAKLRERKLAQPTYCGVHCSGHPAEGDQPYPAARTRLPADWADQEALLGFQT